MSVKIKICGLSRPIDIEWANELLPEYIGFVFAKKSKRCVTPELAGRLREKLHHGICPVGVFVNEAPERVAELLSSGVIDMAQLHGQEDEEYIWHLRSLTDKKLIQAFRIDSAEDVRRAEASAADFILLDHGAGGTGESFDWSLLGYVQRPYFLAGGLTPENAVAALRGTKTSSLDKSGSMGTVKIFEDERRSMGTVKIFEDERKNMRTAKAFKWNEDTDQKYPGPYALDVSSGVETDQKKDYHKMRAFVKAVRESQSLM